MLVDLVKLTHLRGLSCLGRISPQPAWAGPCRWTL